MLRARYLLLFITLCATSVAQAGLFDDKEARRQITELSSQFEAHKKSVEGLETRLQKFEELQRNLAELLSQIEAMKTEMAQLRGQIEVLTNETEVAQKRQKDFYIDLDSRLRRIEQSPTGGVPSNIDSDTKTTANTTDSLSETKAYETALNIFKIGNYKAAISSFQDFLKNHSKSSFAPSAQYWIGNAYFALHDFRTAIENQQKVINTWPDSPKAADAMLNIATCQIELGEKKVAKKTLETLISTYPNSPAVETAKQRLARLK